ncbi:MAG: asparagine synthase (glutamine-hydrolyzing) [Planctomycetes bacterium]|nr:asparagine synthase (glutamine-hydrolyzing) [Planctomycetota bacterium]
MCGIAGILRFDRPPTEVELKRMTDALAHRGPDGEGVFLRDRVGLGHRRLAIIDLHTGDQPMHSADGALSIVFNGEIYNYRELAEELRKLGREFRTKSDTEVILQAYAQWGADCVTRLRGMFAFCIVDFARKRWFMARDHFGIKPLYLRRGKGYIAFGSELSALRVAEEAPPRGRLQAIEWFLRYQYIPAPETVFHEIEKLPSATYLEGDLDGNVNAPRTYWRIAFNAQTGVSDDEWLERLDAVMADSVRAHLIADVPVGVFVSGGIDSTLVASHMARLTTGQVKAFSIGFEEPGFSELPYASEAAKVVGVQQFTRVVKDDFWDELPKLVAHYGEPYGDNSMIPMWQLARLAREHVKVALSGDGGDEGFGGYGSYVAWLATPRVREYWRRLRRGEGSLGDWLWAVRRKFFGRSTPRPSEWERIIKYTSAERRRSLWRHEYAKLASVQNPSYQAAAEAAPREMLDFAQYLDWQTYLPGDVLAKVDVATMYHGLEARTPLIDLRVVELATQLPESVRMRGEHGKWLLKESLRKRFNEDFVNRPKHGFGIPRKHWFLPGRAGRRTLEHVLLDKGSRLREWFDGGEIERLIAEHGEKDRSAALWLLLVLGIWCDQNRDIQFS